MSKKSISPELLDKYLAGECTVAEVQIVELWYAAQDDDDVSLDAPLSDLERQILEEDTLQRIKSNIGIVSDSEEETLHKRPQ